MKINRLLAFLTLCCMLTTVKGYSEDTLFENMPKGELHLHLGGSFPKEYLLLIATSAQQEELLKGLKLVQNGIDYNEVFAIFQIMAQVINTEEKLQKGVEELCLALQKDGIRYV